MGRIHVIADDLTGAADAAVAFAARGLATEIRLGGEAMPSERADVTAISLDSRDAPESALGELNSIVENTFAGSELCLRKIDSMFRGNTFVEIALLAHTMRDVPLVLAPAYPTLGRKIIGGYLHWHDHTQSGALAVEQQLQDRGVRCVRHEREEDPQSLTAAIRDHNAGEPTVYLCGASVQEDLDAVVVACLAAKRPILWIGSGGLALALATALDVSASHRVLTSRASRDGRVLFLLGSNHPVTQRQADELEAGRPCNASIYRVERGVTTAKDIVCAAESEDIGTIRCLFLTGGDTAAFALQALGARSLVVVDEFAPGVPLTRIGGGVFDGVDVVLKSGGFGDPNLLCQVANRYSETKENVA